MPSVAEAARGHNAHHRAFARFVVVGAANTVVFYGCYLLLHRLLPYLLAGVVAQLVALAVAFLSNARLSFKVSPTLRSALLYPLSNFGAIALRTAWAYVLVEWFGVSTQVAPLAAVALVLPVSYLATRAIMLAGHRPEAVAAT